ncbi:MAG: DUF5615 family PIN-like protein [Ignavibacteriales bacterium]|nr:DUF5615 family PIN-like protein [Ignavibacteriales bacterium]
MKILCDVHIAIKVSKFLSEKGIETKHINQILDRWNTKDQDICKYVDKNDFVVLTKDRDFKDSHFINQTPKKLIKVNLDNVSTNSIINIFGKIIERLKRHFDSSSICYIEINSDGTLNIIEKKS